VAPRQRDPCGDDHDEIRDEPRARGRIRAAAIAASTEIASIVAYSAVRRPMVDGSPTDGGLAGYLRNGTRNSTTNAAPASQ